MRIVTWNINSVRLRIDLVLRLLKETKTDVLCLQETKSPDEVFPNEPLEKLGYTHIHKHGMKGYNGVAMISRLPFSDREVRHWCDKQDCRHAVAHFANGVELHNVYVPAGGDVPDPDLNDKFKHKLRFIDEQAAYAKKLVKRKVVLVGDLNVAPLVNDVWSHKQLLNVVSHTPIEVEKFTAWQQAGGFVDAIRHFLPEPERVYTWWSYRNKDWKASNRGRRLDHIWVTKPLQEKLKAIRIMPEVRDWPRGSDHVPVILDLKN